MSLTIYRGRFLMIALTLTVTVLLLLAGAVFAQDADNLTLITLEDGETVTGVLENDVNAQLYMFLGSAGDTISISMTQSEDSTLDPFLVLMGPNGQVYASDDDAGDFPLSALITSVTLPENGLYFVMATSFTGLRRGIFEAEGEEARRAQFYDLTVSGITTPEALEGQEAFTYFAGEMSIGDQQRVEISAEQPVFYINFTGQEGDVISITTSDDGEGDEVDTVLFLFDSDGNRIAVNDDADNSNLYAAIENVVLEQDGLYLIFATGYQFESAYESDWSGGGSFLLSIEG